MTSSPSAGPDVASPCAIHTARVSTSHLQRSVTLITAHGELDAANAHQFVDYALRHPGIALVLDLSGAEFFGTTAFSAIHTLNVRCAAGGVRWILVPSRPVARLLQVCDPDATLPVAVSVDAAVAGLMRDEPRLLQLIAQFGQ